MDEVALQEIFRRVLLTCITVPAILGSAACAGSTQTSAASDASTKDGAPPAEDGSTKRDASPERDANTAKDASPGVDASAGDASSCQPAGCGGCSCGPGCAQTQTCVHGAVMFGCDCHAAVDAGLSCNPDRSTCGFYLPVSCLDAAVPAQASQAECRTLCGSTAVNVCFTEEAAGDTMVLSCACGLSTGRRPAGFRPARRARRGTRVGRFFAAVAELEAASVDSFLALRAELAAHGAPVALQDAAESAAADEVRHARMVGALARRRGSTGAQPKTSARPVRPLEVVAVENVIEGCVRETFGALTATLQAERATDPDVRDVMRRIAVDETRHASLGWAVARWADARLGEEGRARVAAAKERAIAELLVEVEEDPGADVRAAAGLPGVADARSMLEAMRRELWSVPEPVSRAATC